MLIFIQEIKTVRMIFFYGQAMASTPLSSRHEGGVGRFMEFEELAFAADNHFLKNRKTRTTPALPRKNYVAKQSAKEAKRIGY